MRTDSALPVLLTRDNLDRRAREALVGSTIALCTASDLMAATSCRNIRKERYARTIVNCWIEVPLPPLINAFQMACGSAVSSVPVKNPALRVL
jgi:hypothetical protein